MRNALARLRQDSLHLMPWLVALGVACVAVLLVAHIFFTQESPYNAAYLAGILTAASLALATRQASTLAEHERTRTQSQAPVARARDSLRYLDELMPAMIAYVGPRREVLYSNKSYSRWLGLAGRRAREEMDANVGAAFGGRVVQGGHWLPRGDLPGCRLAAYCVPHFDDAGGVQGVFVMLVDTSSAEAGESGHPQPEGGPHGMGDVGHAVYGDAMTESLTTWHDAGERLTAALENDEFILFSQPIATLRGSGSQPDFREVLLRLREEEENLMPPGAFIPIAEKHNLMPDLDRWVVTRLLEWCGTDTLRCAGTYSINVSGASIGDPAFCDHVARSLRERAGRGPLLCFEFNEGDVLLDLAATTEFVRELKAAGCRFALCGFTGEPMSFKLLKQLHVDYLKIDGGIVVNMLRSQVDGAKVRAIARAAKAMGTATIAQCVESEQVRAALQLIGVDFAQGFAIARPSRLEMPQAALAA